MKEKLKYEAPALTAVEFRTERGFAESLPKFAADQLIMEEIHLSQLSNSEFNAGQFTNVDQTSPSGSWVYTEEGGWF